ncbi:MAG: sigma-54-dependent Fis family transcriptional regulator [Bacteroidetes bacterium]|nr:sigma-54-dependent Fis family transcriptional regulator [Bacteroidota bacterium]
MSVLITFVTKEDPYFGRTDTKPGPILALLGQRSFKTIHILYTPATGTEARAMRRVIGEQYPASRVALHSTGIEDPWDYDAVREAMDQLLVRIVNPFEGKIYHGYVTAGTRQMQATWLSLAHRHQPWLRLLELRLPLHLAAEAPEVREVRVRGLDDGRATPLMARGSDDPDSYYGGDVLYSRRASTPPSVPETFEALFDLEAPAIPSVRLPVESRRPDAPDSTGGEISTESQPPVVDYIAVARDIGIMGETPCVREMLYTAYRFAIRRMPVLITGETGTGKDLLARYIHRLSTRREEEYLTMNCAAVTTSLAESELFGVRKGAYTGATTDREGKFGAAHGGTLFLDEIGDLPPEIQAKLLRALENGEIQRVGDAKPRVVDVRVVAATNRDLHAAVAGGQFRDDLLSRLSVGVVHVPPLRDRHGDIPVIAQHLLDLANRNEGVTKRFSPAAVELLTASSWKRWNVRELRTAIERAWAMAERDVIDAHHFKILEPRGDDGDGFPLPDLDAGFHWQTFLDELRARVFRKAVDMAGGSASAAARILGVSPQAVSQFLQKKNGE